MISLVERSTIKLLFFYVTKAKKKKILRTIRVTKQGNHPQLVFFLSVLFKTNNNSQ